MPKIVKPETMSTRNGHPARQCRLAQMILDKHAGGERHSPFGLEGREHKIRIPPVGRPCAPGPPGLKVTRQMEMQRDVTVRAFRLGRDVLTPDQRFETLMRASSKPNIRPAERQQL